MKKKHTKNNTPPHIDVLTRMKSWTDGGIIDRKCKVEHSLHHFIVFDIVG